MRTPPQIGLARPLAVVAICLLAVAALLATSAPAAAHVHVVATSPGVDEIVPHAEVVGLQFDAAVSPVGDGLEVRNAAGERVDRGDVRHGASEAELMVTLPADLAPGAHVAVWQVAAADGHVQEGAWTFVISGADRPEDPGPDGDAAAREAPTVPTATTPEPVAGPDGEVPPPGTDRATSVRDGHETGLDTVRHEAAASGDEEVAADAAEVGAEATLAAAPGGPGGPPPTWQLLLAAAASAVAVAATWPLVREADAGPGGTT